jgi:asparagine synthetase B (glutamine-hydrolysing)
MCSFLFYYGSRELSDEDIQMANRFQLHRGPDKINIIRQTYGDQKCLMLHNLLDISGHAKAQPVAFNQQIWSTFNGELFNFRDFADVQSDTDALISIFSKEENWGVIDGEFAVVSFNPHEGKLKLFADTFLTKPMFWGVNSDNEIAIASYGSAITSLGFDRVNMMRPNTTLTFNLDNLMTMESEERMFEFSLEQHKTNYNDWIEAFIESVRLRATHGNVVPFVALSSGYDSGAIALVLNLLDIPYHTYTISMGENRAILNKRFKLSKARANVINTIPDSFRKKYANMLASEVESFTYHHEDVPGIRGAVHTDPSAIAICYIAEKAREAGNFVGLSGSGSDEIMSDYGMNGKKIYSHSEFAGIFPEELSGFFPWKKFYGDSMRSYLFKDEMVLGHFGLEGRYPFLSRQVVQEFLSLSANLKNADYKAPIKALFKKYNYPFEENVKLGFNPKEQPANWGKVKKYLKTKLHWIGK